MQTFALAALAGLASAGKVFPRANSTNVPYTTEVVKDIYTTYCPRPTEVVVNDKTHTVTEATTLTITDCPCTVSHPVTSMPPKATATVTKGHNDDDDHDDGHDDGKDVVYTTKVVDIYTTYCPGPTEVVVGDQTHTVTKATTLTVSDACPCTVTEPVNTHMPVKPTDKGDHDDDKNDHDDGKDVVYTTKVVDVFTTYCPGPTEVVVGDQTHTVTKATTLTVTDACPCTVTEPVNTHMPVKPTNKGDHDDDKNDHDDGKDVVYTTKVTDVYTTYCPGPTTVTVGDQTHTVTEPTTLTVSDGCPCTVTEPVKPTNVPVKPTDKGDNDDDVPVKPTDKGDNDDDVPVKPTDKPVKPTDKPVKPTNKGDNDDDNDNDKPDQTGPVVVQPTGTQPPSEQVTGAAAGVKPVGALAAAAAIALL